MKTAVSGGSAESRLYSFDTSVTGTNTAWISRRTYTPGGQFTKMSIRQSTSGGRLIAFPSYSGFGFASILSLELPGAATPTPTPSDTPTPTPSDTPTPTPSDTPTPTPSDTPTPTPSDTPTPTPSDTPTPTPSDTPTPTPSDTPTPTPSDTPTPTPEPTPVSFVDSDGDGFTDQIEALMGSDWLDPWDKPAFGDFTGDGLTNLLDALAMGRALETSGGTLPFDFEWDVNLDGVVDGKDAQVLLIWALGATGVPTLPASD